MQVFILFFFIFPRSMSITPNVFGFPLSYVYYPECIRVPLFLCLLPRMLFGSPVSYVYYPECYSGIPVLAGMPLSQKKSQKAAPLLHNPKYFTTFAPQSQTIDDINC